MKSLPRISGLLTVVALSAALIGCEQAPPPRFGLNPVVMVNNEISPEYQQEIANVLAAMFGTPDAPYALPESGLNQQRLTLAAGAAWSDKQGVDRGLYRKHCVHCHGINGDGRGPTARFLNPYPRDYRQGVFKFKTTYNPAKPTDGDLRRVLNNGVPGTSMPSFSLLTESELDALLEYVKYLSIRGEMEMQLSQYVYDELGETEKEDANGDPVLDEDGNPVMERPPLDPATNAEQAEVVKELLANVLGPWQEANDQVINPSEEELPADNRTAKEIGKSIEKGRELFFGTKANCFTCHGPTGLGDGQQNDFDVWAKEQNTFITTNDDLAKSIKSQHKAIAELVREGKEVAEDEATLDADEARLALRDPIAHEFYPIRNAIPRNLRKGVYRGGRRRLDIYCRIAAGIAGTPMPGVGAAGPGAQGTLSEEEIWNIVDYVLNLPYEPASNPQPALPWNSDQIAN
ncbi:cytochrome c [Lacipirellula parvula]|uniref:Cytochrome c n=1 Tax=Lacipirellula parvula TaxID=2650471 RepID=A0A5K7XEV3_9BACT|nr:cytochrome c [Lacipirellula parvula]BBO35028.1 cytochrome c [Lacipirellula parvula]